MAEIEEAKEIITEAPPKRQFLSKKIVKIAIIIVIVIAVVYFGRKFIK